MLYIIYLYQFLAKKKLIFTAYFMYYFLYIIMNIAPNIQKILL